MDSVTQAEMVAGKGLVGNANQGGRRQISIIDAAVWERVMAELGAKIPPQARRANLMVRGLELANTRKRVLLLNNLAIDQPFGYWFDFGDDWRHQIDVIEIKKATPKKRYPKVTKRTGESPPQYIDWDQES